MLQTHSLFEIITISYHFHRTVLTTGIKHDLNIALSKQRFVLDGVAAHAYVLAYGLVGGKT